MRLLTTLLPHQRTAVEKLMRLRVGGLLMDMGTGKTRTAIEIVARRRERISRVVWVCPVNLKETIRHEMEKHCADEPIYVFDNDTRARTLPSAFWYIVGIESMSASKRVQLAANVLVDSCAFVIVDESSYIKGHRASRTKWITRIAERARYRLILTGTPVCNGVEDLFAQLRFLSPDILGYNTFYAFAANHLEYSERYRGMVTANLNTAYIAARMAPYVYQVTKEECLSLPDKLHTSRYCHMTRAQSALYDEAKAEILLDLDEEDPWEPYTIFRLFTALQQIACGFWRRYPSIRDRKRTHNGERFEPCQPVTESVPCERLELFREALAEIPPGEKVVIWSKYRRCHQEIAGVLKSDYGDEGCLFTGDVNPRDRAASLARFRSESRFLNASPGCGGHGLTLNESCYHVFYTSSFKWSEHLQAEDRSHRIGQERPVTYISLVTLGSIDVRIEQALAQKANLAESFRENVERVRGKSTVKQAMRELL